MVRFIAGVVTGVIFMAFLILAEVIKEMSTPEEMLPNIPEDEEIWGV